MRPPRSSPGRTSGSAGRRTASSRSVTSGGGAVGAGRRDQRRLAQVHAARRSRPGGSISRSSGVSRSKPSAGSATTWSVASAAAAARTCASKLRCPKRGAMTSGREQQQARWCRRGRRTGAMATSGRPDPRRAPRPRRPGAGRVPPTRGSGRSAGSTSTDAGALARAAARPSAMPSLRPSPSPGDGAHGEASRRSRSDRRIGCHHVDPDAGRPGGQHRQGLASSMPSTSSSRSSASSASPRRALPPARVRSGTTACSGSRVVRRGRARPMTALSLDAMVDAAAGQSAGSHRSQDGPRPAARGRRGRASRWRVTSTSSPVARIGSSQRGVQGVDDQGIEQPGMALLVAAARHPAADASPPSDLEQPVRGPRSAAPATMGLTRDHRRRRPRGARPRRPAPRGWRRCSGTGWRARAR